MLEGVAGVLDKGASHATEAGLDLKEVIMTRLRDDMMPLHFQVVSVAHHSWGAMQALQKGSFSPPSFDLFAAWSRRRVTDWPGSTKRR